MVFVSSQQQRHTVVLDSFWCLGQRGGSQTRAASFMVSSQNHSEFISGSADRVWMSGSYMSKQTEADPHLLYFTFSRLNMGTSHKQHN